MFTANCIYHSDLIETLNSKGAIHELYDIINQGIKAVSSEHENMGINIIRRYEEL